MVKYSAECERAKWEDIFTEALENLLGETNAKCCVVGY